MAAVAVGWGQYLNEFLDGTIGVTIPDALSAPPGDGGIFNLPALIVVILAMGLLLGGARESARINTIMVGVKIAALVLFCVIGFMGFKSGNYSNFMPMGTAGVSGAGLVAVLLLHRLRRGLHGRRRGEEPQEATCPARSCSPW